MLTGKADRVMSKSILCQALINYINEGQTTKENTKNYLILSSTCRYALRGSAWRDDGSGDPERRYVPSLERLARAWLPILPQNSIINLIRQSISSLLLR